MAFDATKKEWSELYAFFRLLADGYVYAGTPDVKQNKTCCLPVARVQREEHDGTRNYIVGKNDVRIWGETIDKRIPREDFGTVADLILQALRETEGENVTSPDGVEGFLDEAAIYDLEAKTDDRTDLKVAFYSEEAPLTGLCVRSRIGTLYPLLDGGRTANFKFEQTGIKFASPTINKINAFGEEDDVLGRMQMIERLGGILKYNDVADKIFRSNLSMLDLHMGRMLGEMTRLMWLNGITKVSELTEAVKQLNPLKIKDELITKHGYYEYKVKRIPACHCYRHASGKSLYRHRISYRRMPVCDRRRRSIMLPARFQASVCRFPVPKYPIGKRSGSERQIRLSGTRKRRVLF